MDRKLHPKSTVQILYTLYYLTSMGRERRFGCGRERERVKDLGHEREREREMRPS